MLAVITNDIGKDSEIVLAAIAALKLKCWSVFMSAMSSTILLCLSVTSLYAQIGQCLLCYYSCSCY